jgi:hypothetical protein
MQGGYLTSIRGDRRALDVRPTDGAGVESGRGARTQGAVQPTVAVS